MVGGDDEAGAGDGLVVVSSELICFTKHWGRAGGSRRVSQKSRPRVEPRK